MENSAEFSLMEEVVEQPKADENQQGMNDQIPDAVLSSPELSSSDEESEEINSDGEIDWIGMDFLEELMFQNDFKPSQIFDAILPPLSTQQEIIAELPIKVEIGSKLTSKDRAIDTMYNCPIFLAHGQIGKLPSEATFVRHFEQIGDFRPNVLWIDSLTENFLYPKRRSDFDLKGISYLLLDPHEVNHNVNFTRFNLFCGKILLIPKKHIVPVDLYVVFSNVKELSLPVMGLPHTITWTQIQLASHVLKKPLFEYEILKHVLGLKDPLIRNYQVPYEWLDNAEVDIKVKQLIRNLSPPDNVLPELEIIKSNKEIVECLYDELRPFLGNANQAEQKLCQQVITGVGKLPTPQLLDLYKEIQNRALLGPCVFNEQHPQNRYLKPIPEFIAHHYTSDVGLVEREEGLTTKFNFEGLDYTVKVENLGDVPPTMGLTSFCPYGASQRLQRIAAAFGCTRKKGLLNFAFVKFKSTLSTSWKSLISPASFSLPGSSIHKRTQHEVKISYCGIWAFATNATSDPWARLINNQFLAEVIHGSLKPNLVFLTRISDFFVLPSWKNFSHYLDSFEVKKGIIYNTIPFHNNLDPEKGMSGLSRSIPLELYVAVKHYNYTYSIDSLKEYLFNSDDLRVTIRDLKAGDYKSFFYRPGLRYREISANETPEELYLWMCNQTQTSIKSSADVVLGEETITTAGVKGTSSTSPAIVISTSHISAPLTSNQIIGFPEFGKPIPGLIVGDWQCQAVSSLSQKKRRYVLSRCYDQKHGFASHLNINSRWLTQVPPIGDWYLRDAGKSIPLIFTTDDEGRLRKSSASNNTSSNPSYPATQPTVLTSSNLPKISGTKDPLAQLLSSLGPVPINITYNVSGSEANRGRGRGRGYRYGGRGTGRGGDYYQNSPPFPDVPGLPWGDT